MSDLPWLGSGRRGSTVVGSPSELLEAEERPSSTGRGGCFRRTWERVAGGYNQLTSLQRLFEGEAEAERVAVKYKVPSPLAFTLLPKPLGGLVANARGCLLQTFHPPWGRASDSTRCVY